MVGVSQIDRVSSDLDKLTDNLTGGQTTSNSASRKRDPIFDDEHVDYREEEKKAEKKQIADVLSSKPEIVKFKKHLYEALGLYKGKFSKIKILEFFPCLIAYQNKYQQVFMRYPEYACKFVIIRSVLSTTTKDEAKKMIEWIKHTIRNDEYVGSFQYDKKNHMFQSYLFMLQEAYDKLEKSKHKEKMIMLELAQANCNEQEMLVKRNWEAVAQEKFDDYTSFAI